MNPFSTPKPDWLDSLIDGTYPCKSCPYSTDIKDHLKIHTKTYHNKEYQEHYILYMECNGSIDGRNDLNDLISNHDIDCTGGQSAYEDGDLKEFGDQLVIAARQTGVGLYRVLRMYDPGLGLIFDDWWVNGGIKAGVFQEYQLPDDVIATWDKEEDSDSDSRSGYLTITQVSPESFESQSESQSEERMNIRL
ncbi:MAG: hypothetical protein Barrevirus32_3 [Barrevirus sp.]|uniref:C2H2-type domain-containing protein n=1 Tax=Barrevirus sp. TaxID=2487763 RepID=A0A3G4ZQY6_9VIRU|nr:MAG: hypothetical protein Barrevirus32_3 [Barrevirus sp.]